MADTELYFDYSLPAIPSEVERTGKFKWKSRIDPKDLPPEIKPPPSIEEITKKNAEKNPDKPVIQLQGKLLGPHGVTPGMPLPVRVKLPQPSKPKEERPKKKDGGVSLAGKLTFRKPNRVAREPQDRPVPGHDNGPPVLIPVNTSPIVTPRSDQRIFEHPIIGGKFTVFVLCYGHYTQLHYECIESLLATVPLNRMDLRIAANEPHSQSRKYFQQLISRGVLTKYYHHDENILKYPAMREMFYDKDCPIRTNYLIWLDDDTICNRNPGWLWALAHTIVEGHSSSENVRMFGPKFCWQLQDRQIQWIQQARWYKGKPFLDPSGIPAPDGRYVQFAAESFFALHVDTMRQCNIPDPRFRQTGGGYMIGAQLLQGGYSVMAFDSKAKQHVNWSSYRTRGVSQNHTGLD